jgi:hypothetical protein
LPSDRADVTELFDEQNLTALQSNVVIVDVEDDEEYTAIKHAISQIMQVSAN